MPRADFYNAYYDGRSAWRCWEVRRQASPLCDMRPGLYVTELIRAGRRWRDSTTACRWRGSVGAGCWRTCQEILTAGFLIERLAGPCLVPRPPPSTREVRTTRPRAQGDSSPSGFGHAHEITNRKGNHTESSGKHQ